MTNGAGMNNGAVADGDLLADHQRETARRVGAVMGHVADRAVLDVGLRADLNRVDIATQYGLWPHRHIIAQLHLANDAGLGINPDTLPQLRLMIAKRAEVIG